MLKGQRPRRRAEARPLLTATLGNLELGGRRYTLRMDAYEARPGHVICKGGKITCSPYATVAVLAQALELFAKQAAA